MNNLKPEERAWTGEESAEGGYADRKKAEDRCFLTTSMNFFRSLTK